MDPDSPDFNPCVDHYRSVPEELTTAAASAGDGAGSAGAEDDATECVPEDSYPLPEGVVCDHEAYK